MSKYDVYETSDCYLVEVQADILSQLNVRVVIPLMKREKAPKPARRLNPAFIVQNQELILVTQYIGTVPSTALNKPIANLSAHFDEITNALDMLFQGF